MEALSLQAANRFDLDTLVGLMQAYYAHEEMPFHVSVAHAAMFRLLSDDSLGVAWLVRAYGELVGYVVITFGYSLQYGGRYAAVDEFYIDEQYRGQGIGTAVLEQIETYCASRDLRAIELETLRGNWRAKLFYERLGYQDDGSYLMVKRLNG